MPDGRSCEASDDECIGAEDEDADDNGLVENISRPMFEEQDEESESTESGEE
jgi:hypothetical protein